MIRPPPHRLPSSRRGLALIEVVLVSVMALVTLGSLFLASSANMHALQHGGTRTDLQARASRLMDRVLRAVHEADRDSLAGLPMAPVPLNAFTYDEPQSVSALDGAVTVATMRIQLEYEPGDPNDGVDNDGDELVDEGRVVLIRDFGQPGEVRTVLCSGVRELLEGELPNGGDDNGNGLIDERGLCVTWDGARMAVRVTLEKLDAQGRAIVHTLVGDARVMN
jgi:hypothetical protein